MVGHLFTFHSLAVFFLPVYLICAVAACTIFNLMEWYDESKNPPKEPEQFGYSRTTAKYLNPYNKISRISHLELKRGS